MRQPHEHIGLTVDMPTSGSGMTSDRVVQYGEDGESLIQLSEELRTHAMADSFSVSSWREQK